MLLKRVLTRALNQDPLWQSHSHLANAWLNANLDGLPNASARAEIAPDDLDFEGLRQPSSKLPDFISNETAFEGGLNAASSDSSYETPMGAASGQHGMLLPTPDDPLPFTACDGDIWAEALAFLNESVTTTPTPAGSPPNTPAVEASSPWTPPTSVQPSLAPSFDSDVPQNDPLNGKDPQPVVDESYVHEYTVLPTVLNGYPLPLTSPIPDSTSSPNRGRACYMSDSKDVVAQQMTSMFERTHLGFGSAAPQVQQNDFVDPIPEALWDPSQAGCSTTAASNSQPSSTPSPPSRHLSSVATPQSTEPCDVPAGELGSFPDNVQRDRPPPQPRETTSTQATKACGQPTQFGVMNTNAARESTTQQLGRPMTPPSGARFADPSVYGHSPPANRMPPISRRSVGQANSRPAHRTQPRERMTQPRTVLKGPQAQGALARRGSTSSQGVNSGGETLGTALLQSIFAPPTSAEIPTSQERATPTPDVKGRGKKRVRGDPQDSEEQPKKVTVRKKASSNPKPKPRVMMIQGSNQLSRESPRGEGAGFVQQQGAGEEACTSVPE